MSKIAALPVTPCRKNSSDRQPFSLFGLVKDLPVSPPVIDVKNGGVCQAQQSERVARPGIFGPDR
jgi:hypothetical protein